MIRFAAFAAPTVALGLALAGPVAASPHQAAEPAVAPEAVRAWLTQKGGAVDAVRTEAGQTWISIADQPLRWSVFFYDCGDAGCGAIQYSSSFSNPTITPAMINDWNRDHRFLKAYFLPAEPGGEPRAVVQYDVLVHSPDVEALTDPTAVWLGLLGQFATSVGYLAAE